VNLLRWFASPISVLIVTVAVAVYLNRDVLPEKTGGQPILETVNSIGDESLEVAVAPAPRATGPDAGRAVRPSQKTDIAQAEVAALEAQVESSGTVQEEPAAEERTSAAAATEEERLALWKEARRAAWVGDAEGAIERYKVLVRVAPDNPDVFGELGNVHVGQGNWKDAVEVYYRAAVLLAEAGETMLAWRLQRIMRSFDHEKAEALYQKLMQPQSSID